MKEIFGCAAKRSTTVCSVNSRYFFFSRSVWEQRGVRTVPTSTAKYEFMCNDCQECHDLSAHTQRAQWVWKVWKGICQEVSEAHTNAPHFHVCTLSAKRAYKLRTVSQPTVMSVATQNSKLLVATLLSLHLPSEAAGTSAAAHVFPHAGFAKTFPNFFFFFSNAPRADSFPQTRPAHSPRRIRTGEMWHLMFTLINRMHTYNTLPHREPCCVLSGRTQMAATWCVLMGSFDGSGQDMHTHTDGNTLRVARRWTCWLLICSDQWFTTWSSVNGRAAPTELAHWLGTRGKHHRIHAECTSQGSFKRNSFFLSFFFGLVT